MKILFLHGWQSVPGGVKPTYLAEHGHQVINPKLPDDDFEEALQIAQAEFDKHQPEVVVGSSRGGAVAMNINSGDAWLVLLCPAWKKWGTAKTVRPSTVILHSRADDVVPFVDSEELIKNSGLPPYVLMEVGNDHRLADRESLELLLEACADDDEPLEEVADETPAELLERDWTGLCYTAALSWVRATEDDDWLLFRGTVLSHEVGKRINHAWCERGDVIVDLAMPVGSRIVKRELYYRVAEPEVSKIYSSSDALMLVFKNRHDGPWDESEQLREGGSHVEQPD